MCRNTWSEGSIPSLSTNNLKNMNKEDIINKIIEKIPNCSLITDNDQVLYEEFFKCEVKKYPYHYSRNWIFIRQITNGRGIKYFDKKKEHLITIAPDWGGDTPDRVYLPLGVNVIESVPFVVKELKKILNKEIVIKKVYGEENRDYLVSTGIKEIPMKNSDDFNELDDDKYPEIICDVDSIIKATYGLTTELKMSAFKKHIKQINKKVFLNEYKIEERSLTKDLYGALKELVEKWGSDIAERTAKQFNKNNEPEKIKKWMVDVYYPHFIEEYAGKADNKNIICYLTFINDKPTAFTSAYPISKNALGVNASFCDIEYPGMIQYLFYRLATKAKMLGYPYLNLGSNDIESQHLYKSSMGKKHEVYPYIFEYK